MVSPKILKWFTHQVNFTSFDRVTNIIWDPRTKTFKKSSKISFFLYLFWVFYFSLYFLVLILKLLSLIYFGSSSNDVTESESILPKIMMDICFVSLLGVTVMLLLLMVTKRREFITIVNQMIQLDKKLKGELWFYV